MLKLLKSKTIVGLLMVAIPYLDQLHQYLSALPEAAMPKEVALAVTGLGWLLALYGRLVARGPILK